MNTRINEYQDLQLSELCKDTFYDTTKGIECGYSRDDELPDEHAKNCRMG
jgi:hypothetical protein